MWETRVVPGDWTQFSGKHCRRHPGPRRPRLRQVEVSKCEERCDGLRRDFFTAFMLSVYLWTSWHVVQRRRVEPRYFSKHEHDQALLCDSLSLTLTTPQIRSSFTSCFTHRSYPSCRRSRNKACSRTPQKLTLPRVFPKATANIRLQCVMSKNSGNSPTRRMGVSRLIAFHLLVIGLCVLPTAMATLTPAVKAELKTALDAHLTDKTAVDDTYGAVSMVSRLGLDYGLLPSMRAVESSWVAPTVLSTSEEEKAALVDIYHATNGEGWINSNGWLEGDPCVDSWHGVRCFSDGRVAELVMYAWQTGGNNMSEYAFQLCL